MLSLLFGLASRFQSGVGQGRTNIPWFCKYVVCRVSTFRQQLSFLRERLRRVRHNRKFNSHPGRGFNRNYPNCSGLSTVLIALLVPLPFSSLMLTSLPTSSNQDLSRLPALSYLLGYLHSITLPAPTPIPSPTPLLSCHPYEPESLPTFSTFLPSFGRHPAPSAYIEADIYNILEYIYTKYKEYIVNILIYIFIYI